MRRYKYSKKAGALQEAMPMQLEQIQSQSANISRNASSLANYDQPDDSYVAAHDSGVFALDDLHRADEPRKSELYKGPGSGGHAGIVHSRHGRKSMFFYTVEDGQRVMVINRDGTMYIAEGPCRVRRRGKRFRPMDQHVAHPGEFLIIRYRDGRQEHLVGPADVWFDSREHMDISKEECIQIAEKEAVVVYSKKEEDEGGESGGKPGGKKSVERRIVHGPEDFMPMPGEWLHTFSWHGSKGGQKVPNALLFQKLWLLPDQMYHDIPDVRTADGVVLTIRLMLFFQLVDIAKMLETTHDPIGDFVNAATSDVVAFVGKHDFESFKDNTGQLNTLETYEQLVSRAELCGYVFNKVVYRGYGAPAALVQMHEQAMESRTRLQLEKATQQQAQDLEDLKLERRLEREVRERAHQASGQQSDLEMSRVRRAADLEAERERRLFVREQSLLDAEQKQELSRARDERQRQHLEELARIGVNLTEYLTQSRADQVIELRGSNASGAQVHVHDKPTRKKR